MCPTIECYKIIATSNVMQNTGPSNVMQNTCIIKIITFYADIESLVNANFVWPAKCYKHAGIFMTLPINIFCKFKDSISLFIKFCFAIIFITFCVFITFC